MDGRGGWGGGLRREDGFLVVEEERGRARSRLCKRVTAGSDHLYSKVRVMRSDGGYKRKEGDKDGWMGWDDRQGT